jgi:hypothetical protein
MSSVTCVSGCSLPSARRRPGRVKSVGCLGSAAASSQFAAPLQERGFEFHLGGVDKFSGGGFFLFGKRAELFHQGCELAVGANPRAFGLLQRGEVGRGFEFRAGGLFQRFDFVQESSHKLRRSVSASGPESHSRILVSVPVSIGRRLGESTGQISQEMWGLNPDRGAGRYSSCHGTTHL